MVLPLLLLSHVLDSVVYLAQHVVVADVSLVLLGIILLERLEDLLLVVEFVQLVDFELAHLVGCHSVSLLILDKVHLVERLEVSQ